MAESIYLRVAQYSEDGLQLSRKKIIVIRVLLEPQVDQCLCDMPDGMVDRRSDRVIGLDFVLDNARL